MIVGVTCMDTHGREGTCMDTHGSEGTCMDTCGSEEIRFGS